MEGSNKERKEGGKRRIEEVEEGVYEGRGSGNE